MDRKTLFLVLATAIAIIGTGFWVFNLNKQSSLATSNMNQSRNIVEILPSKTFKSYSDPAGFSFNYPDNISLTNNDLDGSTYSDLKLTINEVEGGLSFKITDSKFKSNQDWVKTVGTELNTKEVNLGNLKALEIQKEDKLLLGAVDQGILFTVEVSLANKKDFWLEVYNKVISEFSFITAVQPETTAATSSEVSFDGEEVVE